MHLNGDGRAVERNGAKEKLKKKNKRNRRPPRKANTASNNALASLRPQYSSIIDE